MPPTIQDILQKYMIQDADRLSPSGESLPYYPETLISSNCKITPLIDGKSYFDDLHQRIRTLGNGGGDPSKQGIYIAGWRIDRDFKLQQDSKTLIEVLEDKAKEGVDVRILVWVSDYMLDTSFTLFDAVFKPVAAICELIKFFGYHLFSTTGPSPLTIPHNKTQTINLGTLSRCRNSDHLRSRSMVNFLDHPLGAAHMKFVLVYDDNQVTCYTGGIDLCLGRLSNDYHLPELEVEDDHLSTINMWHDVQGKIEGSVNQILYDHYRRMWNEIINRESNPEFYLDEESLAIRAKPEGALPVANRTFVFEPKGKHYIQSLVTLPQNDRIYLEEPTEAPISFAPKGVFQFQLALDKVIKNAESYIYIEDQALWSRELFQKLHLAIKTNQNLKLVLFTGQKDPDDSVSVYGDISIKKYLLEGLAGEEEKRIALYQHVQATVHSKLWIVDDRWAFIGSSNMMNRSLYTDIEHGIGFVDEDDIAVRSLRMNLWGEHFGLPPVPSTARIDALTEIQKALYVWNDTWGVDGAGFKLPYFADVLADLSDEEWQGNPHPIINIYRVGGIIYEGLVFNESIADRTIQDLGLRRDTDLTNMVIHFTEGPNAGKLRVITSHNVPNQIFEYNKQLANSNDSTSRYHIYTPRITMIDLEKLKATYSTIDEIFLDKHERLKDAGVHP